MNIVIQRYENPKQVGWAGNIQPEDKSWIAFIGLDGKPLFYLHRDPETGRCLPDDPEERARAIAEVRAEQALQANGLRTGSVNDGSAIYGDGHRDPHEIGEVIHPLGISGGGGDVEP